MSRVGNLSSSGNYRLMGLGSRNMTSDELLNWKNNNPKSKKRTLKHIDTPDEKFNTYVEEKQFERDLGHALDSETNARPTVWGTLVEEQAFEKMGLKYSLVSKVRFYHEKYKDYWNGMPDVLTDDIVGDIKSPWTRKSFCTLMKSFGDPLLLKENHPDYYWQLVSNAILCNRNTAMLIIYMPYKEDLEDIRDLARKEIDNRFAFINWADDEELPYLIKGKKYKDINVMEFEIPKEDKESLTTRVKMAIKILKD